MAAPEFARQPVTYREVGKKGSEILIVDAEIGAERSKANEERYQNRHVRPIEYRHAEPPDEQRKQEPRNDLPVGLKDLHGPRFEIEAVETEGQHQIEVVERLEYQIRRKELE